MISLIERPVLAAVSTSDFSSSGLLAKLRMSFGLRSPRSFLVSDVVSQGAGSVMGEKVAVNHIFDKQLPETFSRKVDFIREFLEFDGQVFIYRNVHGYYV
jgi:hypothetical protein